MVEGRRSYTGFTSEDCRLFYGSWRETLCKRVQETGVIFEDGMLIHGSWKVTLGKKVQELLNSTNKMSDVSNWSGTLCSNVDILLTSGRH
jgi:hypothetical protein